MTPSELIDQKIANISDWRGKALAKLRKIINSVDPEIKEGWKWDTAVWDLNGMVCAISEFKDKVKINFFKGAKLNDPKKLINAGLESKQHRSIDFFEGDEIDEAGVANLVEQAIELNS